MPSPARLHFNHPQPYGGGLPVQAAKTRLPVSSAPMIDLAMCERLVSATANSCTAKTFPAAPAIPQQPEWDAIATSFASLGAAFAWGSILLGVVALLGGIAWGIVVKAKAEAEARAVATQVAQDCVEVLVNKWLTEKAPQIIRENVELLGNATLGSGNDEQAADDIGGLAG